MRTTFLVPSLVAMLGIAPAVLAHYHDDDFSASLYARSFDDHDHDLDILARDLSELDLHARSCDDHDHDLHIQTRDLAFEEGFRAGRRSVLVPRAKVSAVCPRCKKRWTGEGSEKPLACTCGQVYGEEVKDPIAGGRKGPLDDKTRADAAKKRKEGACESCRKKKVKCTHSKPVEETQGGSSEQSGGRTTYWDPVRGY